MEQFTELHNRVPVLKDKTKMKEAMERFHELEQLATPKKVKMIVRKAFTVGKIGSCPNCGEVARGNMKHCDYCGQKLDWSE